MTGRDAAGSVVGVLPVVPPLPLRRLAASFDHPEWLYELKIDGFRAVAYVEGAGVRLVSRTGHVFKQFRPLAAALAVELAGRTLILDGEVGCFDGEGRSCFDDLFFRRGTPIFAAFDVMHVDGVDVVDRPLLERKALLRDVVPFTSAAMLYVDHVLGQGEALYAQACARDLEGIVAKWAAAPYRLLDGESSWVKIKNRAYTQAIGRAERFERRRRGR